MAYQKLPTSWPERELLREKGQFWTPEWVADAMVSYLIGINPGEIFDPAVGTGAFFLAAKRVAEEAQQPIRLRGTEIDPLVILQAKQGGLAAKDLDGVEITDFVLVPPTDRFPAIVANPPYIRHHRLSEETKRRLREFGRALMGFTLDGRAGYHIYFLLRALERLAVGGRLAFIMPADTVEGKFAGPLWEWITTKFRLDAVITFAPEASPFPGVDTNALVFLIAHEEPATQLKWVQCLEANNDDLTRWIQSDFSQEPGPSLNVRTRDLSEALRTGLSRPPRIGEHSGYVLGDFARVMRGIATGDNNFFFLTRDKAKQLGLPAEFLHPALGRTRDIPNDVITTATLKAAEQAGRPTLLFTPDGRPLYAFPPAVAAYLRVGIDLGLPDRALISQRKPWYKMEVRPVPPFLFAYLGRRNSRFIRNLAGVVPLTSFLCVYPRVEEPAHIEGLWRLLSHEQTVRNLQLVGKSYGSGAIKVEPRALEQLPLPQQLVEEVGLAQIDTVRQGEFRF